jgi:Uma2 family endonuclease
VNAIPPDLLDFDVVLENGCEWIDGQIVEKAMGAESALVGGKLLTALNVFLEGKTLGLAFNSEAGYRIAVGSSRRIRKPDVTFVAAGRFPNDRVPRGDFTIAPDLMAEVISPNDTAEDMEQRIADFTSVGTRLFWVVYPATRTVWVLRADGSARRLTEQQELSGEDVIPGFTCPVASLFAGITPAGGE